ncbi:MAG: chemotaxis response regulator protein-glutamate methylesterase [Gemmatimonadales bacterium]
MAKIRVLVVDDAVVVRRILTEALAADSSIEVVGVAANGRIALQRIPQVNPDVVTLDVEMPELDGLATLREIRKTWPRLPVIMFSTLTERGAATTLEALSAGASDYVTKPANVGSVEIAQQRVRDEIVPKIKALCGRFEPTIAPTERKVMLPPRPKSPVSSLPKRVDILAIGTSTGGPNALGAVLPLLPADFPIPIVITQHMPPVFTKLLAERLTARGPLKFFEGEPGARLEPGIGWVAPGDHHMVLARDGTSIKLKLNQEPPENSCRPAVDPMFRSVVEIYGERTLAVILTGMGQDGLRGCEQVKEAGGHVVVQDEQSSVVWGMPGFVAQAGLADSVLPLDRIAMELVRIAKIGRTGAPSAAALGRG